MLKLNILTPKGTSLRDSAHFEPSRVKIGQRVWSLPMPQKKKLIKKKVTRKWHFTYLPRSPP